MRIIAAVLTASLASACQHTGSYIEQGFTDTSGVVASEITDVLVRRQGSAKPSVWVVEPRQSDNPFAETIPASISGAGFPLSAEAPPLLYYVTKLYDGFLVRVNYMGEWTARYFRMRGAELTAAGPVTIQKKGR